MVRGSSYCRHHRDQEPKKQEKAPRRRTKRASQFAPIKETAFQASPEVRELTPEQEILTEVPGKGPSLEDFLDIPLDEYRKASHEELYDVAEMLGFNTQLLPPRHSEKDRDTLLGLIEDFYNGRLDQDFLTPEGLTNYLFAQEYLHPVTKKTEERHKHPHKEDIEGSKCCICMDEDVKKEELLACRHAVCVPCLRQLTKAECPVCRAELAGPTVDADILNATRQREVDDKIADENANLLVALALQENPDADPIELYDRYYVLR